MGVWSGWQAQLCGVATVPNNADNRGFLTDWHNRAATNCRNNPVDIHLRISGSRDCRKLFNPNTYSQNYANPDQAAGQFRAQLHSGNYPDLLDALQSGDPYGVADAKAVKVSNDLVRWGSGEFAHFYGTQTFGASGGDLNAPGLHKGWHDLRRTTNKHAPDSLHKANKSIHRALRELSKARRVRF